MKKLLLLFIVLGSVFASCSNDDDNTSYIYISTDTVKLSNVADTAYFDLKIQNVFWSEGWVTSSNAMWCNIFPDIGVGSSKIMVTAAENPSDKERKTTVNIISRTWMGTVTVIQDGTPKKEE